MAARAWQPIDLRALVARVGLLPGSAEGDGADADDRAITWVAEGDVLVEVMMSEDGTGRVRGPLGPAAGYRVAVPVGRDDLIVVFVERPAALTTSPPLSAVEVETLCGPAVTAALVETLAEEEPGEDTVDVDLDERPGAWDRFMATERVLA